MVQHPPCAGILLFRRYQQLFTEFTDHAWVGSLWTYDMIGYILNGAIRFDHRDNWLVAAKRS